MLKEETTKRILDSFLNVNIVTLFLKGYVLALARHRLLKERLIKALNQVQISRTKGQVFFSTRHFTIFFSIACDYITKTITKPFDFIKVL
jgi:hypothetical protein